MHNTINSHPEEKKINDDLRDGMNKKKQQKHITRENRETFPDHL